MNTNVGARGATRRVEYGRTYVVRPKGRHQATIVWLHGLGDNGSRFAYNFLSIHNFKFPFFMYFVKILKSTDAPISIGSLIH